MSRILYVPFDGVRVSKRWAVVLHQARAEGVRFHINSGHRSMREQWKLYRANMSNGHPRPGHPLTAVPSPLAPHVRTGNPAHALDVNSLDGGETRLQKWLERKGVHPTNPVGGESWHLELPRAELTKLWRRYR
jgi:hypothetical protein